MRFGVRRPRSTPGPAQMPSNTGHPYYVNPEPGTREQCTITVIVASTMPVLFFCEKDNKTTAEVAEPNCCFNWVEHPSLRCGSLHFDWDSKLSHLHFDYRLFRMQLFQPKKGLCCNNLTMSVTRMSPFIHIDSREDLGHLIMSCECSRTWQKRTSRSFQAQSYQHRNNNVK